MTIPTRANREGDSQPLPTPSTAPISHRLVQNDLLNYDPEAWQMDMESVYQALLAAAFLIREKMEPPPSRMVVTPIYGDLEERLQLGISRYGQPLRAFNGRDSLRDAYEEVLDALVYLRTAMFEIEHPEGAPDPGEAIAEPEIETLKHMAETAESAPIRRAEP